MNRRQRFVRWLKRLLSSLALPAPAPKGTGHRSKEQPPKPEDEPDRLRYQVLDGYGRQVAESETLKQAHRDWQQLTDQKGRIIDTETGEDVTPDPDDKDRYVVLGADNRQLASFDDVQEAIEHWRTVTKETGKIIDMRYHRDLTAQYKGYLTQAQLEQAIGYVQQQFTLGRTPLGINPETVRQIVGELNRLKLPVFSVTNIAGSNRDVPKETIPITRREVTIELVREVVEIEAPGPRRPSSKLEVSYPTDEQEIRRIRRVGDISRVPVSRLAMPRSELERRLARRQLPMTQYQEEIPGEQTVRKRKVWQEIEKPKVREWVEQVEISEESQAQLLEIVVDVSPSMTDAVYGEGGVARINLAIALAVLLIGKHLDDGSRYLYRQFAGIVGGLREAASSAEKRQFLSFLVAQKEDNVGAGTNIKAAIDTAADDVRMRAAHGDRPEILLLSDGDASITAEEVYAAVGQDVTMHTVITNSTSGNLSLKAHSSTYYRLGFDGYRLTGWDY